MSADELFKAGGALIQTHPDGGGAGEGRSGDVVSDWLSRITGAYQAVQGAGSKQGPAPHNKATDGKSNLIAYGALALGAALVLWLVLRKK